MFPGDVRRGQNEQLASDDPLIEHATGGGIIPQGNKSSETTQTESLLLYMSLNYTEHYI